MLLRQSTSQIVRFGPFLDSTDGVTPETGLTIAQADMQISKDGAAFAQKNAAGNATHDSDGWYDTTLDATDTNTLGEFYMQVNVSGALPVWIRYVVVPAATYDAIVTNGLNDIAATDIVSSGAITTSGGAVSTVTTATNLTTNNDKTGYSISGTKTTLDALNDVAATDIVSAGAITTLAGAVVNVDTVDTTTTNTDMRGTDNALLSASYTAPDNAGITANGNAIAALNDITAADVWNAATRELTSGNNIVLAKDTGVTGFNDLSFSDVWTGTLTESYAANGSAMTPAQGIHMIWSDLRSPQQVSTTWTDFQLDNTTTAMTFTLDDATTPTKKTRAS